LSVFVDTSVWSLAFRRDPPSASLEALVLTRMLEGGEPVIATGLVLQELLQGFTGPRAREQIISRFSAIPLLVPDRRDHIEAAELRNTCRRNGIQIGTVDALLAQLCIRHDLTMLAVDQDFQNVARKSPLKIWTQ
jgi:predicted nucleic acid-binding protein